MNNSKVIILKMVEKLQNVENCDKLAYPSGTIISLNIVKMVEEIIKRFQHSHISNSSNSEKSIKAPLLSSNELEWLVISSAGSGLNFLFWNSGDPGLLMIVGSGLYFLFRHLGSFMSISSEKVSFSPSKLGM